MPTTAMTAWSGKKLEPAQDPDLARAIAVSFVASLGLLPLGTVLGQVTATGLYRPYNAANNDGSEVARGILVFDINVDANGLVTYTTTSGQVGDEFGMTHLADGMYYRGVYNTADLTGLDLGAITDLGANLFAGTVASGMISF